MNIIEKQLFKTNAVKVSGTGTPFWYTSGTFGPLYINTHYLFGGEETAVKTLKFINETSKDKYDFPAVMTKYALDLYNTNGGYKKIIDYILELISKELDIADFDFISGGERRDWFFSYILAYLLHKPHLTIYKNLTVMKSVNGSTDRVVGKNEGKVLHVSDLVTKGSSYMKYWLPALANQGFDVKATFTVVDRNQGGEQSLKNEGLNFVSGTKIDSDFFEKANKNGMITKNQRLMMENYMIDAEAFMRNFVKENPLFLKQAIEQDEKTRQRAIAFIKKSDYVNGKE